MLTFTWCWPLKPRFRLRPFETTVGLRLNARICWNPACACRAAVTCRAPQRAQIVRPRRKFGEVPDDLIANHEPCGARTIEPGIGTDVPRRAVVGATAEYHTEGEALRFEIVAGKPMRGRARSAREPFPAARSVPTTTSASNGGSKGSSNEDAAATFVRDRSTLAHPRHGSLPRQSIVPARQCSI
jgi:hypothetical protein